MKQTMSAFAAAAAALLLAGSAGAQVCAGFPTADGQGSIGALVNFPTDFDQYGVEGSLNGAGPLAVNAGYLYSKTDDDHLNTFRGGAAYELGAAAGNFGATVSFCPNVRADYTWEDGITLWQVPIGFGVGASVPVGRSGTTLALHVIPALVWSRMDQGGAGLDESDTAFGARAGAALNFDRFFVGATSEWVDAVSRFNGEKEFVVGVRAGFKF